MARKKREAPHAGTPWMNTFADLMNLLLCFFVMLFAMSNIDAEKFEQLSVSMSNSFGILDAGGSSLGQGQLISSGMSQLNNLDQYINNMGQQSQKSGNDYEKDKDSDGENSDGEGTSEASGASEDLNEAIATVAKEMQAVSEDMYDKVSDLTDQYNLGDYVELGMDPDYQYVQISLRGSVLFDSGEADIKKEAKPILAKIGELLKKFEGYTVEIEGHTDNVPMVSSTYKDNNWLSSARALNAAEYLIKTQKLDASRIKYTGRGEYEPVASNATSEGRARNRRIEIKIYNELSRK